MTDNENIKALENLHNRILNDSSFLAKVNHGELSALFHIRRILELHEAEIERLTVNMNAYGMGMKRLSEQMDTAKTEAIKEFAELVKMEFYKEFDELIPSIMADRIDNLVKEMTEVSE